MSERIQYAMRCPKCNKLSTMKAQCRCLHHHKIWACHCGNKWETVGATGTQVRILSPGENVHKKGLK